MHINIKQLRDGTLRSKQFEFVADIFDIEPTVRNPITISGEIVNRAEMLILYMEIKGERELLCDRCTKEFSKTVIVPFESCIVEHLDNEDDEDYFIVCESDELDIEELAVSMFILGFDSKNLCSEDCKGLCHICGANLNEQMCSCTTESIDPRLAVLAQLLDD